MVILITRVTLEIGHENCFLATLQHYCYTLKSHIIATLEIGTKNSISLRSSIIIAMLEHYRYAQKVSLRSENE